MLLFGALVTVAIVMRRNGESHKRLLLLATISALGPLGCDFATCCPRYRIRS